MYKQTIGIIGGFGAYATLDFYERFLNKFKDLKNGIALEPLNYVDIVKYQII